MSTVRTHLSALVNHTIVDRDVPHEAGGGLTAEMWQKYLQDCKVGAFQIPSVIRHWQTSQHKITAC